MQNCSQSEMYKLSHTCKIGKLNKVELSLEVWGVFGEGEGVVGCWLFFFCQGKHFEFVIHHDSPRRKKSKSEF